MRRCVAVISGLAIGIFASEALAGTYDLVIADKTSQIDGKPVRTMAINGQIPGPLLKWREGEDVTIRVTNRLSVPTSVHWHGIIPPNAMDGVPGLTFKGIAPGQTFVYRFTLRQSGTYWYHSHSALQEQSGVYGSIVVTPKKRPGKIAADRRYDRDYVVLLSDQHSEDPHRIMRNLKRQSDYYNWNKQTLSGLLGRLLKTGSAKQKRAILREQLAWDEMRMDATDISDISGYTFLMNGKTPAANWTALFRPGERVRLRFINASAMSFFDVRIPGLKMTVVQADSQDVVPVSVDRFRMGVAETYDVIVQPAPGRAYTIMAAAMDRSGYAKGTLAPRPGMTAAVPTLGPRPVLKMSEMGPHMHGGEHAGHAMTAPGKADPHAAHRQAAKAPTAKTRASKTPPSKTLAKADPHAGHRMAARDPHTGHTMPGKKTAKTMAAMTGQKRRELQYADLRSAVPLRDHRPPAREIVVRLTGSMERYIWTLNDRKLGEDTPIQLRKGERVRLKFINETMMDHPMHLHGLWMELIGPGGHPVARKHTVIVRPGHELSVLVTADATGKWALHCHLLFHMEAGMMTSVEVTGRNAKTTNTRKPKATPAHRH
ncbi:MAG: copper resistance system multicopper oxidase [Bauldia litoralis]